MEFGNAILLFDKPVGWTSFDVVNKVKRLIRAKTGHAGTLDPLAHGLLVLATGTQTRQMEHFKEFDKEYTGTLMLGASSPSFDLETKPDAVFPTVHISEKMIEEASVSFIGEKLQMPPAHSAKWSDGKRYYEYARSGTAFKVQPHLVTLKTFEITGIRMPLVDFRIVCGKGYYVRSLVNDFGKLLNSGAYLSDLCRTRVGPYLLRDAWSVSSFEKTIGGPFRPANGSAAEDQKT